MAGGRTVETSLLFSSENCKILVRGFEFEAFTVFRSAAQSLVK